MEISKEILTGIGAGFLTAISGYTHLLLKLQKLFLDVEVIKEKQKSLESSVTDHSLLLVEFKSVLGSIKESNTRNENTLQLLYDHILNNKKN